MITLNDIYVFPLMTFNNHLFIFYPTDMSFHLAGGIIDTFCVKNHSHVSAGIPVPARNLLVGVSWRNGERLTERILV